MRHVFVAVGFLGLVGAPTLAHGPQLQITRDANQITTRGLHLDQPYGPTVTPEKSAYVIPLALNTDGGWYVQPDPAFPASGAGLAYGTGFVGGSVFRVGPVAPLKFWDGAAFVDTGAEELEVFKGVNSSKTSDPSPVGVPLTVSSAPTVNSHSSVGYRLLGDGVNVAAPSADGVYLLTLQITSSDTTLAASDPYFFLLHKRASVAQVQGAVAGLGTLGVAPALVQYVPEPAGAGLAGLALAALCGRRRSARRGA